MNIKSLDAKSEKDRTRTTELFMDIAILIINFWCAYYVYTIGDEFMRFVSIINIGFQVLFKGAVHVGFVSTLVEDKRTMIKILGYIMRIFFIFSFFLFLIILCSTPSAGFKLMKSIGLENFIRIIVILLVITGVLDKILYALIG